jgi:dihydrodipicolinate synthase/N-acetylneuraminate lyase
MYDLILAIEELGGIDNFAGIKYTGLYTNPGYMDAQRVLEYKEGKYEVLAGREEMMLQSLSIGIKGHIGSQFNVAGDLYNAIRTTYEAEGLTRANEDKLRLMQSTGLALIAAWADPSPAGVNGNKVFMNLAGVEVGDGRLPTIPADDDTIAAMRKSFSDFCKSSDLSQTLHMCNEGEE